jgi:hypothetical protein
MPRRTPKRRNFDRGWPLRLGIADHGRNPGAIRGVLRFGQTASTSRRDRAKIVAARNEDHAKACIRARKTIVTIARLREMQKRRKHLASALRIIIHWRKGDIVVEPPRVQSRIRSPRRKNVRTFIREDSAVLIRRAPVTENHRRLVIKIKRELEQVIADDIARVFARVEKRPGAIDHDEVIDRAVRWRSLRLRKRVLVASGIAAAGICVSRRAPAARCASSALRKPCAHRGA